MLSTYDFCTYLQFNRKIIKEKTLIKNYFLKLKKIRYCWAYKHGLKIKDPIPRFGRLGGVHFLFL
jgi:hypothetical protein